MEKYKGHEVKTGPRGGKYITGPDIRWYIKKKVKKSKKRK